MRKTFILVAGALAAVMATAAGCGQSAPDYRQDQAYYEQPQMQRPVTVQQDQSFLSRHGDAIIAGGAGYLAGKMAAKKQYRESYRPRSYYSAPKTYYSRPAYRPSSYRSSSFGSYRSRR